jgi:large subunit ribosomal protein LP0
MPSEGGIAKKARKQKYKETLLNYINTYKGILIITVDNVGSKQMQQVRMALRGQASVLMGKNTIMRKVIRDEAENNPKLECLLPYIVGNMGFVFSDMNLNDLRAIIEENKVPAAARGGQIAPKDVVVPAGPTALDPGQTNFFQALNIATKITKGAIEILTAVQLIRAGERVTSSAVAMLNKIGLKPFSYGIVVTTVYEDGSVYAAEFLDMTDAELANRFGRACAKLAAISFAVNLPNTTTVPHSFANALKKLIALSLATDYVFEESKQFKEFLENPELLAAAKAAAAGAGAAAAGDTAAVAAAPEPEEEEEEEEGVDLFGGGEDADY